MSAITLRFTRNSPLRTSLIDEATGHVMYQIDTPIRIVGSVTRIRKFDESTQHLYPQDYDSDSSDDTPVGRKSKEDKYDMEEEGDEVGAGPELPEASNEIARINWKWFSSDSIIFRGRGYLRTEFLPKCGKMKGSFMFTGPDGVQYRWALGAFGMSLPKLVTTDENKKLIAEFHRAHHFTRREKPKLEIQPEGMDMLDYIVLTFAFVEHKRKERKSRARASGAAGAAGGS